MKSFVAAAAFFLVALTLTALVYGAANVSATAAYSTENARVEHEPAADGRLAWSSAGEDA